MNKENKQHPLNILIMSRLAFKERHRAQVEKMVPTAEVHLALNAEEAGDFLEKADILVTSNWDFKPEIYKKAKNLKWVHAISAGVEDMLFPEMVNSEVLLSNARGIFDTPAAEHTLAVMLSFSRGMIELIRSQNRNHWNRVQVRDLQGATLGVIGLGSIGREIARMAKVGFNMKVIATKRHMTDEKNVDILLTPDGLPKLLSESDFVVLAAALTPETVNLIGSKELQMMKPTAVLINIARGQLVDDHALIQALQERWIAGAGLDVFRKEPLTEENPFYGVENLLITAHRAGFTHHMLNDERIDNFCENLGDYISGKPLRTLVNKSIGY